MFGFMRRKAASPSGNMFLFVGRSQKPESIISLYGSNKLISERYNLHVVSPEKEWYAKPFGVSDQSQSLKSLKATVSGVSKMVGEICERDKINRSESVLVGYSSGAVLAFSLWLQGDHETMVSHNGCVLDVESIPPNKRHKECLLIHNRDDDCFAWEERYLPTKNTLVASGYDVTTLEGCFGGHSMTERDVSFVSTYLDLY